MKRLFVLIPALCAFGMLLPGQAQAEPRHQALHQVLYDVKEAIKELEKTDHKLGGHKEAAIRDLRAAEVQIERGLEFCKDPWDRNFRPGREHAAELEKFKDFRHLRHSEAQIERGIVELKKAEGWGEHKEKAIRDMEAALVQVKLCLKELR
jgi:hypothetical protein